MTPPLRSFSAPPSPDDPSVRSPSAGTPVDPDSLTPSELAWRGVELCRDGDWPDGLQWLCLAGRALEREELESELPALFYSYLGSGMARYRHQLRLGLVLCRNALQVELYQPEAHYFLAKTLLLRDDRRSALDVIRQGLAVDPEHRQLLDLQRQLGERKSPVVPFLARRNPLNRWLGRLRHNTMGAVPMSAPLVRRADRTGLDSAMRH